MSSCEINIRKMDPEISQFRLDFVHFQLVSLGGLGGVMWGLISGFVGAAESKDGGL